MNSNIAKKKKIALVLSGGGSLGAYEVGAIKVLEEHGYSFDIVTGTSIGALNGAFCVSGQSNELERLWSNITPTKVMVDGFNFNAKQLTNPSSDNFNVIKKWSLQYVKDGVGADISPFKDYIRNSLDVDKCMESNIKFGITTAKFPTFSPIDMNMNNIKDKNIFLSFLHASSACFPVFPIEYINGIKYVDGFYNDNLPIRLAFDYGADEVFAIDMKLFDKKPQHKFYLSLPNVHYIAPYISLGSMLDFSQEAIQKNIKLGYLDTKKYFGDYRGFCYTFKDVKPVDGFLSYILHNYGVNSEFILNELSNNVNKKMDELDYFIRSIESIAIRLDIQAYYEAYTIDEFVEIIKKSIQELNDEDLLKSLFEKGKELFASSIETNSTKTKIAFLLNFSVDYLGLSDINGKPLLSSSLLSLNNSKKKSN